MKIVRGFYGISCKLVLIGSMLVLFGCWTSDDNSQSDADPTPQLVQAVLSYASGAHDSTGGDPMIQDVASGVMVERIWVPAPDPFNTADLTIDRIKGQEKKAWCIEVRGSELLDTCQSNYKLTNVDDPAMTDIPTFFRIDSGPLAGDFVRRLLRGSQVLTSAFLKATEPDEARRVAHFH